MKYNTVAKAMRAKSIRAAKLSELATRLEFDAGDASMDWNRKEMTRCLWKYNARTQKYVRDHKAEKARRIENVRMLERCEKLENKIAALVKEMGFI